MMGKGVRTIFSPSAVLDTESEIKMQLDKQRQTTLVVPAKYDQLIVVCEFVTSAARSAGLDPLDVDGVEIAVEEACANIVKHAYGGEGRGDIECTCFIGASGLTVTLRDFGRSFDPASVPKPYANASLEDTIIGGWGLHLIHRLMDVVRFEFSVDSGNVLTMVKFIKAEHDRRKRILAQPAS
jgi:serine/threonine-protein kinase RsbW